MKEDNKTLNFKILLAFTDAYQALEQEGKITQDEMTKVLSILDTLENRSLKKIIQDLTTLFPSISLPDPLENNRHTGAFSYSDLSPELPGGHDTPRKDGHLEAGSA